MTVPEAMDGAWAVGCRALACWAMGLVGAGLALVASGCEGSRSSPAGGSERPSVRVRLGERVWTVETATTPTERYRGLSYRTELAADGGMLFVFPDVQHAEFCMRACEIPLDIAFLDEAGVVVKTWTMAVEPDRQGSRGYPSEAPVRYALEVNAGQLADANVGVGSRMEILGDVPPAR